MSVELKTCRVCKFKVPHIAAGMYKNAKDYRYLDDNGRQWNGNVCANCHAKKCTERAQKKAVLKNAEVK